MGLAAMAATFPIDDLHQELLIEILSHLDWRQQLDVRRVSHRWRAAADASLTRQQELCISIGDLHRYDRSLTETYTGRLLNLLQSMPALRRLCVTIDGRWLYDKTETKKLLTMDHLSAEQLSDSCPQLETLSLDCWMDNAGVETLLRRLPGLRSLHLALATVENDCLSLLPADLHSLSLYCATRLDSGQLHHLTRCRQVRELDLSGTGYQVLSEDLAVVVATCTQLERLNVQSCNRLTADWVSHLRHCPGLRDLNLSSTEVNSEDLAMVVAACPLLERLAVAHCKKLTLDWLPELSSCPHLWELDISYLAGRFSLTKNIDLSGVLTACGRIERLKLCGMRNPLLTFPSISLPGLTHLDLSETETFDDSLSRLPDLLPNLCDLRLCSGHLEPDEMLASVLPNMKSLQVLDLRFCKHKEPFSPTKALRSLSSLSLKALACDYPGGKVISDVLQRCPTLTVVQLFEENMLPCLVVGDLVKYPLPTDREITLIASFEQSSVQALTSELPKNIRVMAFMEGLWEKLVKWGELPRCDMLYRYSI